MTKTTPKEKDVTDKRTAAEPVEFRMTTARPVLVSYPHGDEPSPLHPNGIPAGFTCEAVTPEAAFAFHPNGTVLRYTDGGEFSERKARNELKQRAEIVEAAAAGDTAAVASVKEARKSLGLSVRGGTSVEASRAALNDAAAQNATQSLASLQRVEGQQPVPAENAAMVATDATVQAAAEAEAKLNG